MRSVFCYKNEISKLQCSRTFIYWMLSQRSISSSSLLVFFSILEEISCNLTEFVETSSVCKSSVSSSFSFSSFSISASIFLTSFSSFLSRACSSFCCFQLSFVSEVAFWPSGVLADAETVLSDEAAAMIVSLSCAHSLSSFFSS